MWKVTKRVGILVNIRNCSGFPLSKMSGLDQTSNSSIRSFKSWVRDLEAGCSCHSPCPILLMQRFTCPPSEKESHLAVGLLVVLLGAFRVFKDSRNNYYQAMVYLPVFVISTRHVNSIVQGLCLLGVVFPHSLKTVLDTSADPHWH